MELLCPNCQQMLNLDDRHAGQMMRCPICKGTFTAPSLASPMAQAGAMPTATPAGPESSESAWAGMTPSLSAPAESPASTAETYAVGPETPRPASPYLTASAPLPVAAPTPAAAPTAAAAPAAPGAYARICSIPLHTGVVVWISPVAMTLVFLLSFFPWLHVIGSSPSAWGLAFSHSDVVLIFYVILMVLLFLASIAALLIALEVMPLPALQGWRRPVILGGASLFAFLFLFIRYVDVLFSPVAATIGFKLAFRLHLLAIIGLLLELWLELRRPRQLPPPKIELHW